MKTPKLREKHGPEWKIQQNLVRYLRDRGWMVEVMQGNMFQTGIPDLFIAHLKFGIRFIDVKNPGHYTFTRAQRKKWPNWEKYKVGIWILVAADEENYDRLFKPPNMRDYWKPAWGEEPTVDELLKELE